jgi:hypothetical protein
MTDPALASGRAFLGLIRHVRDQKGTDPLRAVLAESPDATRVVFARPIRLMEWHPYDSFIGFLRAADRVLGRGDLAFCRDLGAVAGRRDLGTILRVFAALSSAERLIRSCGKVWGDYYRNAGRMEAVSWTPEDTRVRIYDFPQMDAAHCRLMEGWMISTMETIGFRVSRDAHERTCTTRGGAHHEFVCTWTRGDG